MTKWTVLWIILALVFLPIRVKGQEVLKLSEVEVDLWPEYDRPGMLVIYHITLPAEVNLPASLTLRLPKAAGEPNAVAVQQPNGQLFSIDYDLQTIGDYGIISFTTTLPQVQVEYYDPRLNIDPTDKTRQFAFTWPGDYTVSNLRLEVQLPPDASFLSITPGPVTSRIGNDGLIYYQKEIGPVNAGQTFSIRVDYQKSTDSLTVEKLSVQPSAPLSSAPTWQDRLTTALPWLLGLTGVLLILGGGYWFLKSGRQTQPAKQYRRSRRTAAPTTPSVGEHAVYCHQCGKRALPGDRFCRSCGTRLRIS